MKREICLMCIICFLLGYFVADVISKCGFGREHMSEIESESGKRTRRRGPQEHPILYEPQPPS